MAEHTPTPWFFYEITANSRGEQDGCGYIRCETDNLEISHHGDMKRSRDENVANAALIVRACNSHDALVKALEDVREELKGLLAMCEGEVPSLLADHHQWVSAIDAVDHADRVLAALATAEPTGVGASHIRAPESDAQSLETREVQS